MLSFSTTMNITWGFDPSRTIRRETSSPKHQLDKHSWDVKGVQTSVPIKHFEISTHFLPVAIKNSTEILGLKTPTPCCSLLNFKVLLQFLLNQMVLGVHEKSCPNDIINGSTRHPVAFGFEIHGPTAADLTKGARLRGLCWQSVNYTIYISSFICIYTQRILSKMMHNVYDVFIFKYTVHYIYIYMVTIYAYI